MSKASSKAITSSTVSRESAPRSSTNDALGVTSPSSTPSCSTMICFTFSSTAAIRVPLSVGDVTATTTNSLLRWLRVGSGCFGILLLCYLGVLLDVADRILDGLDLLGFFVGDFEIEGLLEGHDELDPIERIGAEIVDKRCTGRDLALFHTELVHNDLLDFIFNPGHRGSSCLRQLRATNLSVYMGLGNTGKKAGLNTEDTEEAKEFVSSLSSSVQFPNGLFVKTATPSCPPCPPCSISPLSRAARSRGHSTIFIAEPRLPVFHRDFPAYDEYLLHVGLHIQRIAVCDYHVRCLTYVK